VTTIDSLSNAEPAVCDSRFNCNGLIRGALLILFLALQAAPFQAKAQSLLENWNADAGTPIYSVYAASPSNSQNLIDQPYSFEYNRAKHGIVFGSEKGGHLSFAFEIISRDNVRPQTRYFVESMNVEPRIHTSYSDYLVYDFKPFNFLEVESRFKVYSSQFAIQEVTLRNTVDYAVELDVYPFFQHPDGIRDVRIASDTTYMTFKHDETLDGWGRKHDLPHLDSLYNVFLVDRKPRSFGAYPKLGPLNDDPTLPKVPLADTSIKEGGPVNLADGSSCLQAQPEARMLVFRNDNRGEVLTQKAPQVDGDTLNIPGDGTQQLELSHFSNPSLQQGDSFTVDFLCSQQQGSTSTTVPENPDSIGVELNLSTDNYVAPPDSFELEIGTGHETVFLSWQGRDGYSYDLYRGLHSNPGQFTRIADSLTTYTYFDFGLEKYKSQTYILVARDSTGSYSVHAQQVRKTLPPPPPKPAPPFFSHVDDSNSLSNEIYPYLKSVAGFQNRIRLEANGAVTLRIIRGKGWAHEDSLAQLVAKAQELKSYDLESDLTDIQNVYQSVPPVDVSNIQEHVYWSAYNQLRQGVMPAEGQLNHPYLVNARDATRSWNKAGQSLYTSLSLLSLVHLDKNLAEAVQRNYFEHQQSNGYIPHRLGPYLTETAPLNSENTSAAPWFSWVNWKIFQTSRDVNFLSDAYQAGTEFYSFWVTERDSDGDGLSEWGGQAGLESTREGYSVIWNQVTDASGVEALDLNVMLVKEARALADMATKLGKVTEADEWDNKADQRAQKIRNQFWNETDQFFYHIDKDDHDFTISQSGDLKRKEIIGFLPLWADIASSNQADALISDLEDSQRFWRDNGVPSLAADDPDYNPIGRWNGPMWASWQYFIYEGLKNYNRDQMAQTLVERVSQATAGELSDVHTFKDRYSPDTDWGSSVQAHTPTSVVARMIWEAQGGVTPIPELPKNQRPEAYELSQNYPNPFNPSTRIAYTLPATNHVTLTVYTITGRKVADLVDQRQQAGRHEVTFDAGHLSSGVYTYRLTAGGFTQTRKMMLLK